MRISKVLAVATAGFALAAAATIPATAGTTHNAAAKTKQFKSSIKPTTVKEGQTMTLKGHGAKKNTSYTCVVVVIKGSNYGLDSNSLTSVTSSSSGKVTCKQKFEAFSATPINGGKARHCPLKKADKKAKFRCAIAVSTIDKKSATISYFTAKK
jgi:hypothetical protein